jgi:Fe-S oxidoreductase
MGLADYRNEMELCQRCSACKFIPLEKVERFEHVNVCPSISRYNFHAYSGGGRMVFGVAMMENRLRYSDKLLEIVYNCQLCGACDVSCKYSMDMEVLEPLYEFRIKCVEDGHTLPALDRAIHSLQKQNTMMPGAKAKRGQWADGLRVSNYTKQKAEVLFHAGCRTCYDKDMWPAAKAAIGLLQKAGVDCAIGGENEPCCGGRAYQMGYREDFLRQAKQNMELFRKSGIETLVTGCADCYHAFKVLYDKFSMRGGLEVLHSTEFIGRLISEGRLKPSNKILSRVTYQDPCGLGRKGEPFIHWQGKEIPGHRRLFDPPKEFRRGTYGVYQPPRDVLKSIPGLKLSEMYRKKEYAWCCGAGGGVKETNPDFAAWTAWERIIEAEKAGVEALVTACPGCKRSFMDAVKTNGSSLKIYDVAELVASAV